MWQRMELKTSPNLGVQSRQVEVPLLRLRRLGEGEKFEGGDQEFCFGHTKSEMLVGMSKRTYLLLPRLYSSPSTMDWRPLK